MKALRIILFIVVIIVFFVISCFVFVEVLTLVNPNYIVLENGEKGYFMNIGNMFLGFLLSLVLISLGLYLYWSRIKKFLSK